MASETSEIDWSNDEAVVRAAYSSDPGWFIYIADEPAQLGKDEWPPRLEYWVYNNSLPLGHGTTKELAWASARQHAHVVAFESTLRVQDAPEVVREDSEGKPDPLCMSPCCGHPKSLHDSPECGCGCPSDFESKDYGGEIGEQPMPCPCSNFEAVAKPLSPDTEEKSGKLSLRLPKSLHAQAAKLAEAEGVSLNEWLSTGIAAIVGGSQAWNAALRTRPEGEATWQVWQLTPQKSWWACGGEWNEAKARKFYEHMRTNHTSQIFKLVRTLHSEETVATTEKEPSRG